MNKYKAYTDAANDPHFMQESESMNPSPTSKYYVDPMWEVTSKYYIDRLWEEYHKMKEELADTKSKLGQMDDYISETLQPQLADLKKSAQIAWDELDKSHAERAKLHDELMIAEGQRDQAKMKVEKAEKDRIIYLTRWDELLNVYDAAKAWAEVTDPPRTDNYIEVREATINLLDVVARTFFGSCRPTVTYVARPSHIPVETWEDTRARCS